MALIKVKDSQGNWTVSPIIAKQDVYSTDEIEIGTWIDGKPIYRKVIDFGVLPNNTSKYVPHNISNLDKVINIGGYIVKGNEYNPLPLMYRGSDSSYNTAIYVTATNIAMNNEKDRSGYSAVVILEYTKTTD